MKIPKVLQLLVLACGMGSGMASAAEERVDPQAVNRDLEITLTVDEPRGEEQFIVVANLFEGAARVPVIRGGKIEFIVELVAPVYLRNTSTYLKAQLEAMVLDPGTLISKGESGSAPLEVLRCTRSFDWNDLGSIVLIDSEAMTMTVSIRAVESVEDGAEESVEDKATGE